MKGSVCNSWGVFFTFSSDFVGFFFLSNKFSFFIYSSPFYLWAHQYFLGLFGVAYICWRSFIYSQSNICTCVCPRCHMCLSKLSLILVKALPCFCQSCNHKSKLRCDHSKLSIEEQKSKEKGNSLINKSCLRGKSKDAKIVVLNDIQSEISIGGKRWVNQRSLKCTRLFCIKAPRSKAA